MRFSDTIQFQIPQPTKYANSDSLLLIQMNPYHYKKTFTLLEDHYFQERLEQYQTPFTVYQMNKMYTGTFTFKPADKNWI